MPLPIFIWCRATVRIQRLCGKRNKRKTGFGHYCFFSFMNPRRPRVPRGALHPLSSCLVQKVMNNIKIAIPFAVQNQHTILLPLQGCENHLSSKLRKTYKGRASCNGTKLCMSLNNVRFTLKCNELVQNIITLENYR